MGELKLLDCTLRDGGYVNDWKFGHDNMVSIFERLVDAGIDIIEIGFLDERREFDPDRSIMPDTKSVEKNYGLLDRRDSMIVGMIDYGTCDLSHIQPCKDSFLDGIRVIFKKNHRKEAIQFCGELIKLGYKVFVQLVSVTSYSDEEMLDLIRLANAVKPYAVSMVDTYGLMHQSNIKHYYELLDKHLDGDIALGYHAHNNFQMGYANCIELLSKQTERMIVVDGSIYGMGKSAGNAPLELIAMHMNQCYGKKYHISQILEAIDANISNFYTPATWGYNMFYYIAAFNDCHPNYVSYLMDKRTLSVKSINEILGQLKGEKRLLYDKDYIEELYVGYQENVVDDKASVKRLKQKLEGKKILLLGPGFNIKKQEKRIVDFIEREKPTIISVNMIPQDFEADYIFLSNSKRYVQMATALLSAERRYEIIATSNVTASGKKFDYELNYSELLDRSAEIIDNSFVMLLKVMLRIGMKRVWLAGFDGYFGRSNSKNYLNANMEYKFDKKQADALNHYVAQVLEQMGKEIEMIFITDSLYIK